MRNCLNIALIILMITGLAGLSQAAPAPVRSIVKTVTTARASQVNIQTGYGRSGVYPVNRQADQLGNLVNRTQQNGRVPDLGNIVSEPGKTRYKLAIGDTVVFERGSITLVDIFDTKPRAKVLLHIETPTQSVFEFVELYRTLRL